MKAGAPAWSVYLLRRGDGALYTGIALDVRARLQRHRQGHGAKALRGRGPLRLVASCRVGDRGPAQRVEAAVKRLGKADKEALARSPSSLRRFCRRLLAATD